MKDTQHRLLLLDDVFELEAFLSQRLAEVKAGKHALLSMQSFCHSIQFHTLSVLPRLLALTSFGTLKAGAALCRQQ